MSSSAYFGGSLEEEKGTVRVVCSWMLEDASQISFKCLMFMKDPLHYLLYVLQRSRNMGKAGSFIRESRSHHSDLSARQRLLHQQRHRFTASQLLWRYLEEYM